MQFRISVRRQESRPSLYQLITKLDELVPNEDDLGILLGLAALNGLSQFQTRLKEEKRKIKLAFSFEFLNRAVF